MGFVKEVGDQISKGARGVSNSMIAPSYLYWWVIPFIVSFILIGMLIGPLILRKFTSVQVCKKEIINSVEQNNCKKTKINIFIRLIVILVTLTIISLIISSLTYKIGIYVKNPKLAMGIETTKIFANIFD
jgi:hypothetical protein